MKLELWEELMELSAKYGSFEQRDYAFFFQSGDIAVDIVCYKNGNPRLQRFSYKGNLHRNLAEGPAWQWFGPDGEIMFKEFYLDGKLVRRA
jgi:hypothetical protein